MSNIRRCGVVTKKLGMTQFFTQDGRALPVTVLGFERNVVLGSKIKESHGYNAVIVGYGVLKPHKLSKPMRGILAKIAVDSVRGVKEFRVSEECLIDAGRIISIHHFAKEQFVDATAYSIGKGFAGAMKRHNFSGLEASHGVSVSHRSHGSTGNRTDPGKVFKGKKMAGHLGDEKVTVQNLKIIDIDDELGIIAVLGAVPGAVGAKVMLQDATKKGLHPLVKLPGVYVE